MVAAATSFPCPCYKAWQWLYTISLLLSQGSSIHTYCTLYSAEIRAHDVPKSIHLPMFILSTFSAQYYITVTTVCSPATLEQLLYTGILYLFCYHKGHPFIPTYRTWYSAEIRTHAPEIYTSSLCFQSILGVQYITRTTVCSPAGLGQQSNSKS